MSKKITISERLKPFSHAAGTACLLPGTSVGCYVYPAGIHFYDLSAKEPAFLGQINVSIQAPLDGFTVQLDLEKGCIRVWGTSSQGYLRYRLMAKNQSVHLEVDKAPPSISFSQTCIPFVSRHLEMTVSTERLSLGSHKAQNWQLVKRRADLKEILPHWLRLAQLSPTYPTAGQDDLLSQCHSAIMGHRPEFIAPALLALFHTGFTGMLVPRLEDHEYQGYAKPPIRAASPMALLSAGAELVKSMFVQNQDNVLHLLPALPPEFHCGRYRNIPCSVGSLSLEWTKKTLFRCSIEAHSDGEITLKLPPSLKSCRLRTNFQYPGERIFCKDLTIKVFKENIYQLDRFEN